MKKQILTIFAFIFVIAMTITGCGKTDPNVAVCSNGKFAGAEENGILAFKGIPYAKAPVGDLRWKAPVAAEDSKELKDAKEYGKSSIQYEWHSERIQTPVSEDCLTLNVWTKDLKEKNKPVMVFFHGGSFAWGGSSIELYSGKHIVEEHEDVVVVSCNYRIGMMGFIDFSDVEGGEAFPDSRELGLLDSIESLKWVKKNIAAFGGDPNNITIFGESAGSTLVMCLMASDLTEGLFNRVICESGSDNLTFTPEQFKESVQVDMLKLASGANTMDELMALSEEELIAANELSLDEDDMTVNDYYSLPLRGGKVVPADISEGIAKAKARGVDLLIGTNTDEIAYWVAEMGEIPITEMDEEGVASNLEIYEDFFIGSNYENICATVTEEENEKIDQYLEKYSDLDDVWAKTKLVTEALFRQPTIKIADAYADAEGSGKIYTYYFGKKNASFDFFGACHASEIAYVFHNEEESEYSTGYDEDLADRMCESWVNFAKTGNPSNSSDTWTEYDTISRDTMVIGDDSTMKMESDPKGEDRELIDFLGEYNLWSAGA